MQTSSKKNYIKALVACREYQAAPQYALALTGHKDHLINRVKRILSNSNPSLNRYEKIVLTLCLAAAVVLSATVFHSAPNSRSIAHVQRRAAQVTTFHPVHTLAGKVNSSAPTIATEAEPVPPAGQEPVAEPAAYAALPPVADPGDLVPVVVEPKRKVKPVNNNRSRPAPAVCEKPVQQPRVADRARPAEQATLSPAPSLTLRPVQRITLRPVQAMQPVNVQVHRDKASAILLLVQKQNADKARTYAARLAEQDRARAQQQLTAQGQLGITAQLQNKQAAKTKSASATDEIIAGLEREGIIRPSAGKLTFVLNNETFVVNGATQPIKIFLKYRDQFIASTGTRGQWEVVYRRNDAPDQIVF